MRLWCPINDSLMNFHATKEDILSLCIDFTLFVYLLGLLNAATSLEGLNDRLIGPRKPPQDCNGVTNFYSICPTLF